jgi:hypothetical protein
LIKGGHVDYLFLPSANHGRRHPGMDIVRRKIVVLLNQEYEGSDIDRQLGMAETIANSVWRNSFDEYVETLACLQSVSTFFFADIMALYLRIQGGEGMRSLEYAIDSISAIVEKVKTRNQSLSSTPK